MADLDLESLARRVDALEAAVKNAGLVVVWVAGDKVPRVITKDMMRLINALGAKGEGG